MLYLELEQEELEAIIRAVKHHDAEYGFNVDMPPMSSLERMSMDMRRRVVDVAGNRGQRVIHKLYDALMNDRALDYLTMRQFVQSRNREKEYNADYLRVREAE